MFQKKDITKAIERIEIFYFLVDIVLKDEIRKEGTGFGPSMLGSMTATSGVQNFYPPMGQTVASEPQAWKAAEENINASRENSR
ncbi:nuclear transcription factor Y subunit C-4-like [Capsicum chacoense]